MLAWLSGMRCRLACSPADATAAHYLLLQQIQIGLTCLVLSFWYLLTRVVPNIVHKSSKMVVCVCVCVYWTNRPNLSYSGFFSDLYYLDQLKISD